VILPGKRELLSKGRSLMPLLRTGIPYTLAGMLIVFAGIFALKLLFSGSDHLTIVIFLWLGLFWGIYQPLFKKRVQRAKESLDVKGP
jgi:hypothetical protein